MGGVVMEDSEESSVSKVSEDECKQEHLNESKYKRGIIYLSSIPKFMTVIKLRTIMEQFGQVGRIYLQPQERPSLKKKKKPAKHFSEGWVEFLKKRVAKEVAAGLNNNRIESRKKSKIYDYIWNVKYLSRFKWVHLNERLAYERAVRRHRMRVEISQAKKEATQFSLNVDKSEKLSRKKIPKTISFSYPITQRKTEQEISSKKSGKKYPDDRSKFLRDLFS